MTAALRAELAVKRGRVKFRILEELALKGYTLTRVATELAVSVEAVSKVVNGRGNSKRILAKLRKIGVPEKLLFDPHTTTLEAA